MHFTRLIIPKSFHSSKVKERKYPISSAVNSFVFILIYFSWYKWLVQYSRIVCRNFANCLKHHFIKIQNVNEQKREFCSKVHWILLLFVLKANFAFINTFPLKSYLERRENTSIGILETFLFSYFLWKKIYINSLYYKILQKIFHFHFYLLFPFFVSGVFLEFFSGYFIEGVINKSPRSVPRTIFWPCTKDRIFGKCLRFQIFSPYDISQFWQGIYNC